MDTFIKLNQHLPDMPSESDVCKDGIDVAEMQAMQQRKIEELTLYIIQLQKQIESLKFAIEEIKP